MKKSFNIDELDILISKCINLNEEKITPILKKLSKSKHYLKLYILAIKLHDGFDPKFEGLFSLTQQLKSKYSYTHPIIYLLVKNKLAVFKKNPKKSKKTTALFGLRDLDTHLQIVEELKKNSKYKFPITNNEVTK